MSLKANPASIKKKLVLCFIIVLRIGVVVPFLIFHPFLAYLVGLVLDATDGPIYKYYFRIKPKAAQKLDKLLDWWLYTVALLLAIFGFYRWFVPILIGLYLYRIVGQVLFLATAKRIFLTIFVNYYEVFYLTFYLPDFLGKPELLAALKPQFFYLITLLVVGVKFYHEASLHVKGWTVFDNWTLPLFKRARRRFFPHT